MKNYLCSNEWNGIVEFGFIELDPGALQVMANEQRIVVVENQSENEARLQEEKA